MTVWLVAAIPVLIMFFALAMERLEHRLRRLAVRQNLVLPEEGVLEPLPARRLRHDAMVHSRQVGQRP